MKLFKVTISPLGNPKWWDHAQKYQVWAKNIKQAEEAVYNRQKDCGIIVGRKRIKACIFHARKPIIRLVIK